MTFSTFTFGIVAFFLIMLFLYSWFIVRFNYE